MAKQRSHAIPNHVGCGFETCSEQQCGHRDYLVVTEAVVAIGHLDKTRQQIIRWVGLAFRDQILEVAAHYGVGGVALAKVIRSRCRFQSSRRCRDQAAELGPICFGDTDHCANHRNRQGKRQRVQKITASRLDELVDHALCKRPNARSQHFDPTGRKSARDERTLSGVCWRIKKQHRCCVVLFHGFHLLVFAHLGCLRVTRGQQTFVRS